VQPADRSVEQISTGQDDRVALPNHWMVNHLRKPDRHDTVSMTMEINVD
jgi:hypothetical protein